MRWRVLSVIAAIYAVQFSPAIFVFMTLPIIMRQEGHSATTIGLVQLVGIPYVFKFLWAPLIDKYRLWRDRYKSWIVVLSAIHVGSLVVLAWLDPSGSITPLFIVLFIAILAVSTQDIAVDALTISLLRPEERTMGASFQNFGMYLGAVVGGFGFLNIYGMVGWTAALLMQAALFATPLLALLLVAEPTRARGLPPVNLRNVLRFFTQPGITPWLAILGTMRLPLIMTTLPVRLMLVDQGMSTEEIALWVGLFAMCAAGGVSLFLSPLMRKLARVQAIYLVGSVNVAVLAAICLLAILRPNEIHFAIVMAWAAVALTDVVLFRGAMDKVRPELPGFDFSVQVAILTLLPILTNPITGLAIDTQGHMPVFFAALVLALLPLAILHIWIVPSRASAVEPNGEAVISTATVSTKNAFALLEKCDVEFTEHGVNCSRPKQNFLLIEEMGCKVEMKAVNDSLDIRIETPTENFMTFIRDEIVEHLGEIDPKAVEHLRWSGGIKVGELPSNFRILRASRRQEIFPGLIRVTLSGIDVEALTRDGIHIKIMMPEVRGRSPVWPVIGENGGISWPQGDDKLHARFVTIRKIRLDEREIDVDVAHHDGGLISNWAVLEGDHQEVGVMGPGGDLKLPGTENVVLAADYTGLPAIARLIENTAGEISGHLFAAAPSIEALVDYLPPSGLKVTAVDPDVFSDKIAEMIRNCTDSTVSYAWFAGEFSAAQAARSVFKNEFGLARDQQLSVAYWRKGEPGHSSRSA